MDPEEEFGSSDSEDEDYCPNVEPHSGSDVSEVEEELDEDDDDAPKKGKKKSKKTKNKRKEASPVKEQEVDDVLAVEESASEKEKANALWADFLSSTDTPPSPKKNKTAASSSGIGKAAAATTKPIIPTKPAAAASSVSKIFEFAGETVAIPQKESPQPMRAQQQGNELPKLFSAKRAGVSSVLDQLSKKSKLSVLEKTKVDWDSFKSNEGINEELKTHNQGREG